MMKKYSLLLIFSLLLSGCVSPSGNKGQIVMDVGPGQYNNVNDSFSNLTEVCIVMSMHNINYSSDWLSQVSFWFQNEAGDMKTQVSLTSDSDNRESLNLKLSDWKNDKIIKSKLIMDGVQLKDSVSVAVKMVDSNKMKMLFNGKVVELRSEYVPKEIVYSVSSSESKIEFYDSDVLCK